MIGVCDREEVVEIIEGNLIRRIMLPYFPVVVVGASPGSVKDARRRLISSAKSGFDIRKTSNAICSISGFIFSSFFSFFLYLASSFL